MTDEAEFGGYTREQLKQAWALVRPAGDWKMPVNAVVGADADLAAIDAAVAFFAGGGVQVQPEGDGLVRVTAPGYYRAIGS